MFLVLEEFSIRLDMFPQFNLVLSNTFRSKMNQDEPCPSNTEQIADRVATNAFGVFQGDFHWHLVGVVQTMHSA